jgi:RHS repeat-associated protein
VPLPDGSRSQFAHDVLHRLCELTLPDGSRRQWRYHPGGLLWQSLHHPAPTPAAADEAAPAPRLTELSYTVRGDLSTLKDAEGGLTRWHYDASGDLHCLEDAKGQRTRFEYDPSGLLRAQNGIDGIRSEYVLDALGLPVAVIQHAVAVGAGPHESRIRLERDLLGRLVAKTTADSRTLYRYDALGRLLLVSRHAPGDERTALLLDEVAFAYSAAGDLCRETSTIHALLQPGEDGSSVPLPLPAPRVRTLCHEHDALGNTTATRLPGGQSLNWLHYGSGHLHQINVDGVVVCDFERDALHREVQRSQGGLTTRLARDVMGRIVKKQTRAMAAPTAPLAVPGAGFMKHWDYDALGQLRRRQDRVLGTQWFAFDGLERLLRTENQRPDHPQAEGRRIAPSARAALNEAFAWDAASNALPVAPAEPTEPVGAPRTLGVVSAGGSAGRVELNRVLVWQDIRYHYDGLGRVVRKVSGQRQSLRLLWDAQNQLVQTISERPGGPVCVSRYHYDCLGRRVAVQTLQGTARATTQWFTWSGMRLLQQEWPTLAAANEVLAERAAVDQRTQVGREVRPGYTGYTTARPDPWQARHSEQALTHTLLYEDAESYAPLARIEHVLSGEVTAAQFQYFHTDLNGAPEELTDIDGTLLWQVRYRAWGNTVMEEWAHSSTTSAAASSTASLAASPAPVTSEQNLRFQGQYLDRQTGLHYNTFRYYDPDTGRFLCQDPIGLAGGINLYQYAPNAIDWVDPWGWAAAKNLPQLKGKSVPQIEQDLTNGGFSRTKNTSTGNQTWEHPDGSQVRIDPYGNQSMTMKNGQPLPKSGANAHVHKYEPGKVKINDRGIATNNPDETHIGTRNPKDYQIKRGRAHGCGA